MTVAATVQPGRRISPRSAIVASAVITLIAALLYYEWMVVSAAPPAPGVEQDTACVAARIGLPCR